MERATLSTQERQIIKVEILSWHEARWFVHALTAMPDHVHILATPAEDDIRQGAD